MGIKGEIGLIIKFGLFSGLREEEMVYVHGKPVCENLGGCDCDKLNVLNKPSGMSVILVQWHRGHKKCYFTIVPTMLWDAFRELRSFGYRPHITLAHAYMKSKDPVLHFMWLRKAHYNIMCRSMKPFEANILAGRAKSVDEKLKPDVFNVMVMNEIPLVLCQQSNLQECWLISKYSVLRLSATLSFNVLIASPIEGCIQ